MAVGLAEQIGAAIVAIGGAVGAYQAGLRRSGASDEEAEAETAPLVLLTERLKTLGDSVNRLSAVVDRLETRVDTTSVDLARVLGRLDNL